MVDLDAFEVNADALVRRAAGTPVRIASKSVRVRDLLTAVGTRAGFRGIMAYSVREALWLVSHGARDVLVAYPSVDAGALVELAGDPLASREIVLMVDDPAHLDLVVHARRTAGAEEDRPTRLCLDVDASLRATLALGPLRAQVHLGVRRSPVHTPSEAAAFAARAARTPGVRLVGLMFYEAQVAGLPDTSAAVRLVKRLSVADLAGRRAEVLDAVVGHVGALEIVNSGGTGSLESSAADPVVTEVTAGSGLLVPTLFDGYRTIAAGPASPAAFFGLDVVRLPGPRHATVFGGGYVASGPASPSRLPAAVAPRGVRLTRREGAGEVQTPLRVGRGASLAIGDRVWFRHAKAGEQYERFDTVHLVRGDRVVGAVPTYRGEGRSFG